MTQASQISAAVPAPRPAGRASGTAPFSRFEWMLALRYLRARRRRFLPSVIAGISFVAIMVAVATLIVVMSVMNGFHIELMNKIIGINGHLFMQSVGQPLNNYDDLVKRIARVKGVTHVLPLVESAAGASTRVHQTGALVRGIRESDLKKLPGIGQNIRQGTLDGFDKAGGIAIGENLARSLGVQVGDNVSILTARGVATPFGMAPRVRAYPVKAVFKIGLSEFDNIFIFMPFQDAQEFFNKQGQATLLEAFVEDPQNMEGVRMAIGRLSDDQLSMVDWRQRNKSFFDVLRVERTVMFFILTLIIIVAALSIISGLTMLVKDKGRAIAILRTMGATRGAVMRVFLIIGTVIGIMGTLAGFLLGVLIARNLEPIRQALNSQFGLNLFDARFYFLSRLPSQIIASDVLTVVALAISLSVLATIYPSWRAARLDPVDALRYE